MGKKLLINGVGITALVNFTKIMAHLPLVFLDHPPQKALTICFGIKQLPLAKVLAISPLQLSNSSLVFPACFGTTFPMKNVKDTTPLSHVIIHDAVHLISSDRLDGYHIITLDPPPPVQAAGSSLLYSKEFYAIVRQHLQPRGGILQQSIPEGDAVVLA